MPITKSETLKARIGLSGSGLNRIPGEAPLIPDHEMIRCIGHGSYGEVWLARNAVGTWRAVKVVYRQTFKDARPYDREFAGIQSYEPISRSNEGLIDVLQIGRNDSEGYFYYVMELADATEVAPERPHSPATHTNKPGLARLKEADEFDCEGYVPKTLSRVIQQRGRLSYEECITLGLTLNLALGHLHRHGLIHRDVKPSNIIFVNGVPKLTDIGLVTDMAGAESFVGTEGYIPPEGPNSPQADLYALGKVLYEASMGKDRHEFPDPVTALGLDSESKALMELNAVLLRACAPEPKQRYQRAEEMNADLALLHNGESVRDKHALARRLKFMTRVGGVTMGIIVLAVIPYYLALREARAATASAKLEAEVAQFLKDMLKGAAPSIAVGRDTRILKEILDRTAQRIGKDLQDQPEVEAELASTLGQVYQELAQYPQAEKMLRRSLELRRRLLGEDNLTVAQTMSDLSPALWNQAKLTEGESLQRRALAIRTRLSGPNDLAVAESLQDLGNILTARAKVSEAEIMFRKALEIRKKAPGPEPIAVAQSLMGVAQMVNAQGQWAEAEKLFREALAVYQRLLGPHHPSSAGALNGLVQSLLPQDKLIEAADDAREGLAIQKEVLGLDHPLVAGSLTRLARVLQDQGKLQEAKTNLLEALAIWSKRFNDQDAGIGETISALFEILLSVGDQAEVERLFHQVLTPEALGEHPNRSLLHACGDYYARTGQWNKAADVFSQMIELDPENHHPYQALAALYVQLGDVPAYRRFCQQIRAQFGSVTNDPSIADRMAKSCLILPPDGGDLGTEVRLANVTVTFDANSAATPWFQFCKGLAEYRQGNFNAAREWMQRVLLRINDGSTRDVEAYMVLTMAEHGLNQHKAAQQDFAQGVALAASRLSSLESGDIESGWTDWIVAHALMREAENLICTPPYDVAEPPSGNPQ
jgi:tetratricopeptide (TPR) repeat protein